MDSISDRGGLHRPYPDSADDAAMDAAEREYIRRRTEEDAAHDDAQASTVMDTPTRIASGNIAAVAAVVSLFTSVASHFTRKGA